MSASPPYVIIRLVPQAPVDGAAFATYLENLALQLFDANSSPPVPLSDYAYSSPLIFTQWPGAPGYYSTVSVATAQPTHYNSANSNYGSTLTFHSTVGISVGAYVFSSDQQTLPANQGLRVTAVDTTTVKLSGTLTTYVPTATVLTFLGSPRSDDPNAATPLTFPLDTSGPASTVAGELIRLNFADTSGVTVGMDVAAANVPAGATVTDVQPDCVLVSRQLTGQGHPEQVTFTLRPPFVTFAITPQSATPTANPDTLQFAAGDTDGVAVGMTLVPVIGLIGPGTTVTAVDATAVRLSTPMQASLPAGRSVRLAFRLSSRIAQHLSPQFKYNFFTGVDFALVPAAVATAVVPLNATPPDYLDIPNYLDVKVRATRGTEIIPLTTTFYNVKVSTDSMPSEPLQYQNLAATSTSLYVALPPPPGANPIALALPGDGAAPPFDELRDVIEATLAAEKEHAAIGDPITTATISTLIASPRLCRRVAFDIAWSYGDTLPTPPDSLESLYTNPPNPGGGGGNSSGSKDNNLEQDRQKFEGALSSFYSTHNATAERLAKFIAAASAAVVCEQASRNATTALVDFPVDPDAPFAAAVAVEMRLAGLGAGGPGGVSFGVPAAYFYALGAHLDKTTTAAQRFSMATGDAIERLLQQFATAQNMNVIAASELFATAPALPTVTAFQAARRLSALRVSAASTSSSVTVFAGTPLAALTTGWLSATDPDTSGAGTPPVTYPENDFQVWTRHLAGADPAGYAALDLDALTRGYVLPPIAASPDTDAGAGTTVLTFGTASGIGPGMTVSGPGVAASTTVTGVTAVANGRTVSLSTPLAGSVTTTTLLIFNAPLPPIAATTTADAQPGATLTFGGGLPAGVGPGTAVFCPGVTAGTTVLAVAGTAVTLSARISAAVPTGTEVVFAAPPVAPLAAVTTADCPVNTDVLTLGDLAGTHGIHAGMTVFGTGIPAGTTVQALAGGTVTISTAVTTALPAGSVVTFTARSSTLAEQIAAWLPSTVTPPAPGPTVGLLKQITAAQWTAFFTVAGSPAWLPPFTEPPGAGTGGTAQKAGYIAGRVRAFVRTVREFFTVAAATTSAQLPAPDAPAVFDRPADDLVTAAVAQLPASFAFGKGALSTDDAAAAAQTVVSDDADAQAWLVQALTTVNELYWTSSVVPNPPVTLPGPVSLAFSVAEALFARGFRAAAEITGLTAGDFQLALTGTVAYDHAAALYAKAQTLAAQSPDPGAGDSGFQPVNPDGSLISCAPPPSLSPTGPIAYLQQMLAVTGLADGTDPARTQLTRPTAAGADEAATALTFTTTDGVRVGMGADAAPVAAGTTVTAVADTSVTLSSGLTGGLPAGTPVTFTAPALGDVLSGRRGPLGRHAASAANLTTPLPLVDLVNESLEHLAAAGAPSGGTVYDTDPALPPWFPPDPDGDDAAARLLAALPAHSTPAPPDAANAAVEPAAFDKLAHDFSTWQLPYPQSADIARTYLRAMGSSRFEAMRTFRRCITEFVLDPQHEPNGFGSWLWRYPVRTDLAIEYLHLSPPEYAQLFGGCTVPPCAGGTDAPVGDGEPPAEPAEAGTSLADVAAAAVAAARRRKGAPADSIGLPALLQLTGLSYAEFYDLWSCGYVPFHNTTGGTFPSCAPCCPEDLSVGFDDGQLEQGLSVLLVFVRLWRTLRGCGEGYSFAQLADVCAVLRLRLDGAPNPDFIRQLAALQMLRDDFGLPLNDPHAPIDPQASGAERTPLLTLWSDPAGGPGSWALDQLIRQVERHAQHRHGCGRRPAEAVKLLVDNLDPLSRLAGFDPTSPTFSWHARPTHTLRFAEVLAKIYASAFTVGELLFLFTAGPHLDGDDPFALPDINEARDTPLEVPEDDPHHGLWRLRRDLLDAQVDADEAEQWPWHRVETALQTEFGFAAADVTALGAHFFPGRATPRGGGHFARRFVCALPAADTSPAMWNGPRDWPWHYDTTTQQLATRIPVTDRALLATLTHVRALNDRERQAVQDLYFQPRALLARFALLLGDVAAARRALIEEHDENRRFAYLRDQFLLGRHRSHLIARHLSRHVATISGDDDPPDEAVAGLVLRTLVGDGNRARSGWEDDTGAPPALTWPQPAGGALAALLGLVGTGLHVEYRPDGGWIVWRDAAASLGGFGTEPDRRNAPVPTVLPAFDAALTTEQMRHTSVHNGMLVTDSTGAWLGGAQGFTATWTGTMLIEQPGTYEFWAGPPAHGAEPCDPDCGRGRQWQVTLRRGQRTWVLLSADQPTGEVPLKRGAYELRAQLVQPSPEFDDEDDVRPVHTGLQIDYRGPDSGDRRTEIPFRALFTATKDHPLSAGIKRLSPAAAAYLDDLYVRSLRDIRRTYQRAVKAVLLYHRFRLSARRRPHGTSELGYLLSQPQRFAGTGYYHLGGVFTRHQAFFDPNLLPVRDTFHAPAPSDDARVDPSPQRTQAMFDWWERLFDYAAARDDVQRRDGRALWHLFDEAQDRQPAHPGYLLRHLGADSRRWALDLRYAQDQNAPVYLVTADDLADDRWTLRAWHAEHWLRAMQRHSSVADIRVARPDLWAATEPAATLPGETGTGNANLVLFVAAGCLPAGAPRRYRDLRRINDELRDRGRRALLAYLCAEDRVPLPWRPGQFAAAPGDLSDLLLLDVDVMPGRTASRIEEAITATQSFIRRARLGLEPDWPVTHAFARLWDSRFETYRTWEQARYRELYRENWIEFDELRRARRIEAFRFLEDRLRTSTLTLAAPGGLDWWLDTDTDLRAAPELLQRRVPSQVRALTPPRQGFTTLGSPEWAGQPSWLAAAPAAPDTPGDGNGTPEGYGEHGGRDDPPVLEAAPARAPDPGQAPAADQARAVATADAQPSSLPLWMAAAIRLGTRFLRVAAAGPPPAAARFAVSRDGPACCPDCGDDHPPTVDEYYFWLVSTQVYAYTAKTDASEDGDASFTGSYQFGFQDSYYDRSQQQSADWNDEGPAARLQAKWQPDPAVRLAWCRLHNGQFGQPRRSAGHVTVAAQPDLVLLGRAWDSLYFQITNSAPAPAGYGSGEDSDPSPPGFRYDLAADEAVAVPEVLKPPPPPGTDPGGLGSYPLFAYHAPGARLFPTSWFSPALAVADALRTRCVHDLALRWYRRAFDPWSRDCTWARCPGDDLEPTDGGHQPGSVACCDASAPTDEVARNRAVLLRYCATLIEWGDTLMRRGNSPEAHQQARVLYDTAERITGPRPRAHILPEPANVATVAAFEPAPPPLNPRLMELYDLIADRQDLVRRGLDAGRIRAELPYFNDLPADPGEWCLDEADRCGRRSPYRFTVQIAKASELAGRVRELGGALLAAYEKGDAEYLASLRAEQEREMLALGIRARQDQWRDADWQVQALQQTKDRSQANLLYYAGLLQNGLINTEIQNIGLTTSALQTRTGATVTEILGEVMSIIPDFFVGAVSTFSQIPVGTKLAGLFQAIAKVMHSAADIQSTVASIDGTQAGWQRRAAEWLHEVQTLPIDIEQTEMLILGAHRRRDQAMTELNNQQRQIEHSTETLDFLRDKFTTAELYLYLQRETAAMHRRMYELALRAAREAEHAFAYELGRPSPRVLADIGWDSLHSGLLAGERLDTALHHLEKAYLDNNRRELELTRQFSLRLDFPAAYLRLRTTGSCEVTLPEWLFDLVDYPGHYLRRIKNVSLTLPCVVGPHTGVHCRLTLLHSSLRSSPEVRPPAGHCCPDELDRDDYTTCAADPRLTRDYAAHESIATSTGQNDSGLFELTFHDERYVPFEFRGAVSRWRIELPPEHNYFDIRSLTDVIMRLSYTARDGGTPLRTAAERACRGRLPGDGLRLFDLRQDFPEAWAILGGTDRGRHRRVRLAITQAMFPYIPGRRAERIGRFLLMFAAPDAVPGRHHQIRFWRADHDDRDCDVEATCVASDAWPGHFCGTIDLHDEPLGPLSDDRPQVCVVEFPPDTGPIGDVFLVAQYDASSPAYRRDEG
ncbi:neuraminidase-like domain-containing protein [Dactylosporangium sp. NPDC051541]|uniref:Tc toxin subunit A-related protein n=1 Tax=Dactylosporangium sp. NPDC051541 TaxID=3363977 RepID=UPI0037BB57D7